MSTRFFVYLVVAFCSLLSFSPAFAGCGGSSGDTSSKCKTVTSTTVGYKGGSTSSETVAQTVAAAKQVKTIEANLSALKEAGGDGCFKDESCRQKVENLLEKINAQAAGIEAQIPILKKGFSSAEMGEKLESLQKYVSSLRTEAQIIADKSL